MRFLLTIIPMVFMALLLSTAQAFWGRAVKQDNIMSGSAVQMFQNIIQNPKVWIGGTLYVGATLLYFFILSKNKFFSVQVTMTALSILLSTTFAIIFFHEKPGVVNMVGVGLVLAGLFCVLR